MATDIVKVPEDLSEQTTTQLGKLYIDVTTAAAKADVGENADASETMWAESSRVYRALVRGQKADAKAKTEGGSKAKAKPNGKRSKPKK